MLESIKNLYLEMKTRMEQQAQQSVSDEKIKAEQEIIIPKFSELDNLKQNQLQKAQEEYSLKCQSIENSIEAQKSTFRNSLIAQVEEKVMAQFTKDIADIENKLEE